MILQYKGNVSLMPKCNTSKKNTLIELNGQIRLTFERKVQDITVELVDVSRGDITLYQSKHQLFSTVAGKNTGDWTFEFGNTSKLVNDFQGDKCYLKFIVEFENVPLKAVYRTKTFYLKSGH
jgi:hypothetical protein